jgi:predicted RNA methylase
MELDRRESLDWSYESGKFDDLTLSFIRQNLAPLTWFIDVGANQGLFSIMAQLFEPECSVLAIEPDPYSLKKLKKTWS